MGGGAIRRLFCFGRFFAFAAAHKAVRKDFCLNHSKFSPPSLSSLA
jgi:hypothetical protein